MADEKIVIEVAIDNEAARKQAVELNKQLLKQRKELTLLRQSTDEQTKSTEEYAKEELRLKNEIADTSKELRINNKIGQANAKSKNDLSAQTAKLIAESKKLDLSTKSGQKEFSKLSEKIKSNRETLKGLEAEQGTFVRNVGNYTNSIIDASNSSELFGGALTDISGTFGSVQSGLKGASLGFKGLKGAIIATGVGALLIALTSLVALLGSTRKGAQFLEKTLGVLKGVTQGVIKIFSNFGQVLVDLATGSDNLGASISNLGESLSSGFADAVKGGLDAANSNIKLRESIKGLTVEEQKFTAQAEANRKLRDDQTKSLQQRLGANDRVLEAEKKRTAVQQQLVQQRIAQIQNEVALGGELNDEQLQQQAELQAELFAIQEDFLGRTTEQLTERNALIREANLERVQAEKNTIDALLNAQEEGTAEFIRLQRKSFELQRDLEITQAQGEIANQKALNAQKLLIESEYQKNLRDLKEQENIALKQVERKQFEEEKVNLDNVIATNIEANQKVIESAQKKADFNQKLSDEQISRQQSSLNATQSFFAAGEQLAREGTVANKIFGIANATISTYQAGAQALATVPFPANIAALAAVIGTGLAQVAQIVGLEFAQGGDLSSGGTEGTRQQGGTDNLIGHAPNIGAFRFGGQEFITRKDATLNNMDALQTINQFGANTKFAAVPMFADGGVLAQQQSSAVQSQVQIENALRDAPAPVVKVSDINKGFSNVGVSEVGGTFG